MVSSKGKSSVAKGRERQYSRTVSMFMALRLFHFMTTWFLQRKYKVLVGCQSFNHSFTSEISYIWRLATIVISNFVHSGRKTDKMACLFEKIFYKKIDKAIFGTVLA